MRAGLPLLLLVSLASGCTPGGAGPVTVDGPPAAPAMDRVEGAALAGEATAGTDETPPQMPLGLELVDGRILAWSGEGAWARGEAQDWKALPWGGGRDEVAPQGLRFAVPRGGGGAWLVADNGLYQVASGALVRSPLSDGEEAAGLVTLDSLGAGADEELWLNGATGVSWITGGASRPVSLQFDALGKLAPPSAVVALSAGHALWVTGGRAFVVDMVAGRAEWLGEGLGEVQAFARDGEGKTWLAATRGLYLHDSATGRLTVFTLAAPGAQPANVRDVTTAGGRVLVSAGGQVLRREGDGFRSFGAGSMGARGVRVDAEGRTWVLEVERLRALQTAPPVSFEGAVKPLLQQRCQGCHADGSGNSPVLALADYGTAKALSGRISARVSATNSSPMPPVSAGTLPAAEVGTVLRWISEGMSP